MRKTGVDWQGPAPCVPTPVGTPGARGFPERVGGSGSKCVAWQPGAGGGGPIPTSLTIHDPRDAGPLASNAVGRWFAARLRDPRDVYFVRRAAPVALVLWSGAAALFLLSPPWYFGLAYLAAMLFFLGPFTLMLHATCHRPLFKRQHRLLEAVIPWLIGPFLGHTPGSFFVHHMGMHHPENNCQDDQSATIAYQRDSFLHFLHYWARFFFVGLAHVARYLSNRNRQAMRRQILVGEASFVLTVVALGFLNPTATLFVFVAPFLLLRWFMMCGNWSQHAFVDVSDPDNAFNNSTNLINARYNQRCFNDGYHIVHHLAPSLHWTEMPGWFEARLEEFGRNDAVVFDGLGNNQSVWWCLMRRRYGRLADHLVDLPGQPVRTREEKIAWLRSRTQGRVGQLPAFFSFEPALERPVAAK
ncbi:MAG: fatty acid desaturase [Myxococcota bacterium]